MSVINERNLSLSSLIAGLSDDPLCSRQERTAARQPAAAAISSHDIGALTPMAINYSSGANSLSPPALVT